MSMDIRKDRGAGPNFSQVLQKDNVRWTSPLLCKLQGDVATGSGVDRHMMSTVIFKLMSGFHINLGSAAITKVFEGEPDHLTPSVSDGLLDNDMFAVAGRMIGHTFLHGGPSFPGLSPAIVHILFGGSLETTPLTLRDCPDLDIRDAVKMVSIEFKVTIWKLSGLEGDAELKDIDAVHQLCLSWELPTPNATNRKWLSEKLLLHAVIERTRPQINQFQKGLKETGLWSLLIQRRDVIPILFPRESEAQVTPQLNLHVCSQMILDCIIWPSSITFIFESYRVEDDDESDVVDVCRVSGYLKTFIENDSVLTDQSFLFNTASPAELKSLMKFWMGWEVPATEMRVEIVEAPLPTALTCFENLRLPRHYTLYKTFDEDLCACISTSYSGFGRI
ncbi:hypothetical protein F7725_000742 [Dissostichus mawsoni]|uniref:HECT domain-containing protein n=1 Tax=Dissostichus mawsoni TaxID=36200 RepID=A0A7J5ZIJ1_DISMA|nr:hypothetical protein F7725_000742 [Dissostichus mawsoni]